MSSPQATAATRGSANLAAGRSAARPAAQRTIKPAVWLLLLALASAFGHNVRPEFAGVWSPIGARSGRLPRSIIEIKQTDFTVALRPEIPNQASVEWSVYPTDGTVMKVKLGRLRIERTGRWRGNELILRETGPGNAPWRRSTEQRILSLSIEGRRMTIAVHNLSDEKSIHDYAMTLERVVQ